MTEVAASIRTGDSAELVTFEVAVPKDAFLTGFEISVNGITCTATVEEIEEAMRMFDDAVSSRQNAGITRAYSFGQSQTFSTQFNMQPNSQGVFILTYETSVERPNGDVNQKYEIDLPIETAMYTNLYITINVNEDFYLLPTSVENSAKLAYLQEDQEFPEELIEIPIRDERILKTISKVKKNNWIFYFKSTLNRGPSGNDCQEEYEYGEANICYAGLKGGFKVKYDVRKRRKQLETFVTQYDVAAFISPNPNLNKNIATDIIVVMDTSGSMGKNNKLRHSMDAVADSVLDQLKAIDRISLIEFNTDVKFLGEFYGTKRDRRRARKGLAETTPNGWTNINDALITAIEIGNGHVDDGSESVPVIIVYSDGTPQGQGEIETDKEVIRNNVKAHNSKCFPIYSMGIGEDADIEFLQELSNDNCARSFDLTNSSLGKPLYLDLEDVYGFLQLPVYSRNIKLSVNSTCIKNESLINDLDLLQGIKFIKSSKPSIEMANANFDQNIPEDTPCEVVVEYKATVQNKPVKEAVKICFPNGRSGHHQKIRVTSPCPSAISSIRRSNPTPDTPFITRLRQYKEIKKQTEHDLKDVERRQLAEEAKTAKFVVEGLTALVVIGNRESSQCTQTQISAARSPSAAPDRTTIQTPNNRIENPTFKKGERKPTIELAGGGINGSGISFDVPVNGSVFGGNSSRRRQTSNQRRPSTPRPLPTTTTTPPLTTTSIVPTTNSSKGIMETEREILDGNPWGCSLYIYNRTNLREFVMLYIDMDVANLASVNDLVGSIQVKESSAGACSGYILFSQQNFTGDRMQFAIGEYPSFLDLKQLFKNTRSVKAVTKFKT
jgi:hypothetical protein